MEIELGGEAVPRFFKYVDEQYDEKLQAKIGQLRAIDMTWQRAQLLMLLHISPLLGRLIQGGVQEQHNLHCDIIYHLQDLSVFESQSDFIALELFPFV